MVSDIYVAGRTQGNYFNCTAQRPSTAVKQGTHSLYYDTYQLLQADNQCAYTIHPGDNCTRDSGLCPKLAILHGCRWSDLDWTCSIF